MARIPNIEPHATGASRGGNAVETSANQMAEGSVAGVPPPKSGGAGVVKTGVTAGSGSASGHSKAHLVSPDALTGPVPSLSSTGLHAPVPTPGPIVQQFVTLGRYQLLSRLAVGGMAEVYLARQGELSGFKTLVVVKKVLPHLAVKPDFIAMFLDEARIASMLDHPNIVRITEVGRVGDEYYLAMELVQGKPLAAMLQHGEKAKTPIPHALAALLVSNAAAGLHHAHQLTDAAGNSLYLVHRDVSPQNIMVSFEGSVKVIDFGIARALGRLGDTNSGSLKGKLGYMAPEQARGEPVDARADIFSLGVVLWECVAGRRLFLRENELATLRAVVYEPIPRISKYTKVDPVLETIVEHALERDVEERFQTAEEMRVALERWIFAEGGTSVHDLAALMKSWFASDHQQWQRAARLALDLQESDPPMDVAFPNLAASKTGHSRTGSSRPEGAGSGPKSHGDLRPDIRWDSSSRAFTAQPIAPLPAIAGDTQPSFLRRATIPILLLVLLAGGGLAYWFGLRKPPVQVLDADNKATPARPMVETLPAPSTATTESAAAAHAPGTPTRTEEQVRPSEQPSENSATSASEEGPSGKKKYRSSSGEKRAILNQEAGSDHPAIKRPNPFDERANLKRNRAPRPNPF
jgi:serine/threonine protein kinase